MNNYENTEQYDEDSSTVDIDLAQSLYDAVYADGQTTLASLVRSASAVPGHVIDKSEPNSDLSKHWDIPMIFPGVMPDVGRLLPKIDKIPAPGSGLELKAGEAHKGHDAPASPQMKHESTDNFFDMFRRGIKRFWMGNEEPPIRIPQLERMKEVELQVPGAKLPITPQTDRAHTKR